MLRRSRWWHPIGVCFTLAALLAHPQMTPVAQAADETEAETEVQLTPPLFVVSVASAERLLGDVAYLFDTIERPDMVEVVEGLLSGAANDLDGLDRKRPLGFMVFLKEGLVPVPVPVVFLPTTQVESLIRTFEAVQVTVTPVAGRVGRYELDTPGQPTTMVVENGYVFISNDVDFLDTELPNPQTLCQGLAAQYDLAGKVDIKAIPEGMRNLFLDFLRAQSEAELQQRDDEPDSVYQARRAAGMSNLRMIEAVLKDGDKFVIGLNASREDRMALIDLILEAAPDSALAKQLTDMGDGRNRYAAVLSEQAPLLFSVAGPIQEHDRDLYLKSIAAARDQIGVALAELDEPVDEPALDRIADALKATVEAGELEGFVQVQGKPPGPFVLIGGVSVRQADTLAAGASALLRQYSDRIATDDDLEMELDDVNHRGISFHRFGNRQPAPGTVRIWGEEHGAYIGAGLGAVWFAFGSDDALSALKDTVDQVVAPATPIVQNENQAPARLIVNFGSWLGFPPRPVPEGRRRGRFGETAREAFAGGEDRLEMIVRPTENGFRWQLRFDEGFLRLIGLGITSQYDRSQL